MDDGELHVANGVAVGALIVCGIEDADVGLFHRGIPTDVAEGTLAQSAGVNHTNADVPAGEFEAILPHGEALAQVAFGEGGALWGERFGEAVRCAANGDGYRENGEDGRNSGRPVYCSISHCAFRLARGELQYGEKGGRVRAAFSNLRRWSRRRWCRRTRCR